MQAKLYNFGKVAFTDRGQIVQGRTKVKLRECLSDIARGARAWPQSFDPADFAKKPGTLITVD